MAIKSSIEIKKISDNVRYLGISVTRVKKTALTTSNILLKKTTIKRSDLVKNRNLFQKKRESIRRKDQESLIEVSKLVQPIKRGAAAIARSTQGFLGRLLDFTGTLLTGWLLYNLPTIISMARELMARIGRMVSILKRFVFNVGNIMSGFGNLLNAQFQNLIRFDFNDTSKRVETAMQKLNNTFYDMEAQIDEGLQLITTPLNEGLVTGENAPSTGTQYPAQPQEGAPATTSSGGSDPTDLKSGAKLLMQKGFPAKGAAYLAGNIQQESGWKAKRKPWVLSDGAGTNKGLISWNQGRIARAEKFLGKPLETASASEQIDWIKEEMRQYGVLKTFMNPNATDEQLKKASYGYIVWRDEGSRWKYSQVAYDYLQKEGANAKPSSTPSASPQQKPKLDLKKLGFSVGERAGYSPSRKRVHAGRDIAIAAGTPVSVISDATITDVGFEKGYGYFVAYTDSKGIEHFYGHLREMPKVRKGQKLSAGTIVGYVGSTGYSTGPHLHWEVSPRIGEVGRPRRNVIDPIEYGFSSSAPFGGTEPSAQVQAKPSQRRQQLPSQITPERQGPQILLFDDPQPQTPMPSGGGGGPVMVPMVVNTLNTYIKNKLLLDLAYT